MVQDIAAGAGPSLAMDHQGNGVVVWTDVAGVRVRANDGAGPDLFDLDVPATTATGKSTRFSVAPRDRWSAVASTTWAFGDGTSASGATVNHAYAKAATYSVKVTSADAAGNTQSLSRSVSVRDPEGPATNTTVTSVSSRGCNDGAEDVPQNGVDEDCEPGDARFPDIPTGIAIEYRGTQRGLKIASLLLNRLPGVPMLKFGATVSLAYHVATVGECSALPGV